MRIGELSRRSGVSRDSIRFYERCGLLQAEAREDHNNYKSYPEDALITLDVIADAQAAGISVADLAIILSQLSASDWDEFDGDAFLATKIAEVEQRIDAATRFLKTLRDTRTALAIAPYEDAKAPETPD